jgi:hypothetical protein
VRAATVKRSSRAISGFEGKGATHGNPDFGAPHFTCADTLTIDAMLATTSYRSTK